MVKPVTYKTEETISKGSRSWSTPYVTLYVGDSFTWTWSTNENVVSCDKTGAIASIDDQTIRSGALTGSGTYTTTMRTAGTYFYCSENSQTMAGQLVVVDQPSLSPNRDSSVGPLPVVPSGVQHHMTGEHILTLDGCWMSCFSQPLNQAFNKPNSLASCSGDWLFMSVVTTSAPNDYIIGAFGRKSVVFSKETNLNYGMQGVVPTVLENGAYWFDGSYSGSYWDVGFAAASSPISQVKADWNNNYRNGHYTNCATELPSPACESCFSWGYSGGYIGCDPFTADAQYLRVFLTNTCPLLVPPNV
jgi:plastocyanin